MQHALIFSVVLAVAAAPFPYQFRLCPPESITVSSNRSDHDQPSNVQPADGDVEREEALSIDASGQDRAMRFAPRTNTAREAASPWNPPRSLARFPSSLHWISLLLLSGTHPIWTASPQPHSGSSHLMNPKVRTQPPVGLVNRRSPVSWLQCEE
ncbi:hypothetical protein V8E54_013322 [Elaphomyces granulatus]